MIIVGRGGGSLEDLWAFNEEVVARAIFRSTIPVVSAVGHEIDYTIADFVADARAPTPTAAAHLVVPRKADLKRRLDETSATMGGAMKSTIVSHRRHLTQLGVAGAGTADRLQAIRQRFDEAVASLTERVSAKTWYPARPSAPVRRPAPPSAHRHPAPGTQADGRTPRRGRRARGSSASFAAGRARRAAGFAIAAASAGARLCGGDRARPAAGRR